MPRKANSKSSRSATPEPAVPPIRPLEQDPYLSPIGRDAGGHFARGNAGGPGNPHSRHCAYMLSVLRSTIDETKLNAVIQVLYDRALEGDMSAPSNWFSPIRSANPHRLPIPMASNATNGTASRKLPSSTRRCTTS